LSVDGAFVPLVGGEWAEVKTLVIDEVEPPKQVKGEMVIQTLHQLKHEGPMTVLAEVHHLLEAHADLTALSEPVV
jgi:hypothetical protein